MTVYVKIARRIPKNFYKRQLFKLKGLFTFQENIWIILHNSFKLSIKDAQKRPEEQVTITKTTYTEHESLYWDLEWYVLKISSPIRAKEEEEYKVALKLYDKISNLKYLIDVNFKKVEEMEAKMNTKKVSNETLNAGYDAMKQNSILQKLLDMGILLFVENDWDKDGTKSTEKN